MNVGDRFDLIDEQIHGYVDSVFCNEAGDPASAVIALDDGRWAAVDLNMIVPARAALH